MMIGIHPDCVGEESHSSKWAEFLGDRGIEVRMLNLLAPDALAQAQKCDGIMWRFTHSPHLKQSAQRILHTIEHYLKIPVYPNTQTRWHYDEKTSQYYLLQALQAPIPQTWLFWDRDEALTWAETAPYPIVFKLSVGAGASNVVKLKTKAETIALIKRLFDHGIFPMTMNEHQLPVLPRSLPQIKALARRSLDALHYIWNSDYPKLHIVWWQPEHSYAYFQEFLPDNQFDTRIVVIGNRAFGCRRMNRPNDFRASGSGNLVADPKLIDQRCIEIAFYLSHQGQFQSMAYDFLFKEGEPVINEISYTFIDAMVYQCPGHWDSNLNWIEGQMWAEAAQVEDFLDQLNARKLTKST